MRDTKMIEIFATKVMKWEKLLYIDGYWWTENGHLIANDTVWNPFKNDVDAIMILKKLKEEEDVISINLLMSEVGYDCIITIDIDGGSTECTGVSGDLCQAICSAVSEYLSWQ